MKENYDTSKDIATYMSLAHDVMFTKISSTKGIKQFVKRAVAAMFKESQQLNDGKTPRKPAFGPINNE